MRTWDFALALDPAADTPIFLQIADGVAAAVVAGRLRAGDALPGTRALAALLGVNRNTVVAAYDELRAQGFTTSSPARATIVADDWRAPLPSAPPGRRRGRSGRSGRSGRRGDDDRGRAAFDLPPAMPPLPRPRLDWPKGTLVMQSGVPDVRLLPVDDIARAYRRALSRRGARLLAYADERGNPKLRAALATMLAHRRAISAAADDILVVRGSQMGIDLAARALLRPGDVVAVEELGYSPAWAALLQAGARLLPIPVDAAGIDVDVLARHASAQSGAAVRMVYVTPHHQYPTTVTLSAHRRRALLELCRRHRIAILEDDFDHEIQFEGRPPLPLAAADDAGASCIYVGTLSKIIAPGLRLGFVKAPADVLDRLAALRRHVDRQGDHALEEAVAELLEDGTLLRHVRRMRRVYRARRDVVVEGLRAGLGGALAFDVPRGGMALWAHVLDGSAEAWAQAAAARGVGVSIGADYALDKKPRPYVRLGFGALDERELREALRRLTRAP